MDPRSANRQTTDSESPDRQRTDGQCADRDGAQHTPRMTVTVAARKDAAGQAIYDPEGAAQTFEGGRIDWYA